MLYSDEKDYIMRMIKEAGRMLFTLMLGREYTHVELPEENRFTVSGKKLEEYKAMVDKGAINEAENILLENLDYDSSDEVAGAAFFYRYISEKEEGFLLTSRNLNSAALGVSPPYEPDTSIPLRSISVAAVATFQKSAL